MTNQTPNPEAQPVSQKYGAINKFVKAQSSGLIYTDNLTVPAMALIVLDANEDTRNATVANLFDNIMDASGTVFVRACPLAPRPGVLESTAVSTLAECQEVVTRITETMLGPDPDPANPMFEHGLCDPDGCIMLMPYIESFASAVAKAGHYVTIGEGNAGVTSPHGGEQVVLPLGGDGTIKSTLTTLGMDHQRIEVEFVHSSAYDNANRSHDSIKNSNYFGRTYMVQLRGTEHPHQSIRSAPHPFTISGRVQGGKDTVKEVLTLMDDSDEELARLEEALRGRDLDGVFICHPTGNMSSHHCGQCTTWGASYIITDTIEVGSTWVEVDGWVIDDPTVEPQPFEQYAWREHFERGLVVGMHKHARQHGWLSNHFHQYLGGAVMFGVEKTAYLAGVFAGFLPTAILGVAMGEMRHARGTKKDFLPIHGVTFMALTENTPSESAWDGNRDQYYCMYESVPLTLPSMRGQLDWLNTMYDTGWEGSGYGGKSTYGDAVRKGRDVLDAIANYHQDSSHENFMALLGAVNTAENIVHNNGFFLNKFLSKRAFDIGTDPALISTTTPQDFFAVFHAATDALQWFTSNDLGVTLTDTVAMTDYALTNNHWRDNKERPLFARDSPFQHINQPKFTDGFHGSQSYNSMDPAYIDKYVPCGSHHCGQCKHFHHQFIKHTLTIPLPTDNPNFDMKLPVVVADVSLPQELENDAPVLLAIFKNHVYDDMTIPNAVSFLDLAWYMSLQDCKHPLAVRLVKHYASFIAHAPIEYQVKMDELIQEIKKAGEEE